ncbi:MAG TPA: ATP-dependent sacrificial sulfur transferase LarE [Myxococcales bacterium]|nr:ATP-dependent sacrificial sulfur transferase LarE [Myxococcales bacterium]
MLSPERIDELCRASASKLEAMRALVRAQGSALVAFSAGVDSTLVLKIAAQELGDRAVAVTAISASMAPEEQTEARELAAQIGVRLVEVRSKEIEDPRYAQNPVNRCYFCKTELYDLCTAQRAALGVSAILDGFNADDFKDHRPGHQAAREHQVLSPLAEAGLNKEEIRAWSHRLGLPTWDKPQMACLASRIPYGTSVTPERLSQLAGAESDLRRLGLRTFRVRYHGEVARLEVAAEEQDRFFSAEFRAQVSQALQGRGFRFVSLDLEPFRSGRMNAGLQLPVVS